VFSGKIHMVAYVARVSKNFAYVGLGGKHGPAACVSGPVSP